MAGKSSKSPSSKSFSSVQDIIGEPLAPGLATAAKLSLDALRDLLEATDALPCVKYIAGIGIKILDIADVRHVFSSFLQLTSSFRLCRKYKLTKKRCGPLVSVLGILFLLLPARAKEPKKT